MSEPRIGAGPIRLHGLHEAGEEIVLAAAGRLLSEGLVLGGSAFSPGHRIWTRQNAESLTAALDGVLAESSTNHLSRLVRALDAGPPGAVRLAAELQYLMQLPARDISATTKRDRVTAFLDLLPEATQVPEPLWKACESGVFNVGMGFKMQGWRQLASLYRFVGAWTGQLRAVRDDAASNPWAFKRVVEHVGGASAMRNLLMYLAYPGTFEPIVSQKHKNDIVLTFASQVGGATDDVDRDLARIRDHLEDRSGARISFYSDDLMPRWRSGAAAPKPDPRPVTEAVEPGGQAWLVRGSGARGDDLVPEWVERRLCALPAGRLAEARTDLTRTQVARLVEEGYPAASYSARKTKVNELFNFLSRIDVGDVVATTSDERMFLGRITGHPELTRARGGGQELVRQVDWATAGDPVDVADLHPLLQARLRVQEDVVDLTADLDRVQPLLELAAVSPDRESGVADAHADEAAERATAPLVLLPAVTSALAAELHLPQEWLQYIVDELRDRRQVVLYGPPGTGKTHLATRLARHLTRDLQNVKLVQFHPAYSYEDFFEGYRPGQRDDGSVGFELRPGPFRRLVDRARQDPARPYVLVVDELNRANLATVFGELYFLLEYRNEAIDLLYSGDEHGFTMPENVYLLGTMNTADRSVAALDSAMRRRFSFVALHPAEDPIRSLLTQWLAAHNLPQRSAELLVALNERIGGHELAVGPSYFMREHVHRDDDGLRRLWRASILPLLEEYHYGTLSPADVADRYRLDDLLPGGDGRP